MIFSFLPLIVFPEGCGRSFIKQKLLFVGAVLILILGAVAFVFIPALGGSASGKILEFGKWNGKPIEYIEDTFFVRQFQYMANSLQEQGGELDQFNHYRIMRSAFSAAVLRLAILDELESAGYRPSQALINRYLLPYYMDQNGKYSARIFEETPEITRSQRRNLVTEELTAQRYIEDVFGTPDREFGLKISSKETELLAQMAGPQRSFNYVSFSTSDYPESEILSFGKANEDLFVKYSFTLVTADSLSAIKNVEKRISREEVSFDDAVVNYSTRIGTNEKENFQNPCARISIRFSPMLMILPLFSPLRPVKPVNRSWQEKCTPLSDAMKRLYLRILPMPRLFQQYGHT